MSIVVKEMKMPKNCRECCLFEVTRDMVSGEVLFLCKCRDVVVEHPYSTRDNGCTLTEVPTLHGRLIDIDDAIESYGEGAELGYVSQSKFLDVVIRAEGNEE